ncbi:hypothetical protein [Aridibaculum aurantiacum]|uniref:hypothetical protein n=1 Tax=Aridibaculum aurantiacum TaxID=2810307 RepID=UPI001A96F60F|nr:hypothetical protein [Aridibaculum aurantiacum]
MKQLFIILLVLCSLGTKAQKVDSIFFNLYTDSLKKGVHNYINVDGKLSNGSFFPLTSSEISLSSSYGKWDGNSLIIDSAYKGDSVVITAVLKDRPEVKKHITIFIKKVEPEFILKSEQELMEGWRRGSRKKSKE